MIIKRTYYYYVSTQPNLEKQIIKPTIPDNFLTRGRFIDWKLKRIRLYQTIEDAISGLYLGENFRKGTRIYVYRAVGINKDYLHGPQDITKVPYALVLPEYWYTSSLRLESLGEIKLEKKGEEIFKYGPRQTVGKIYKWRWYEERSYSILSDVYHSGLKRTYKKNVGRLRRNISTKLSESILKDITKNEEGMEVLRTRRPILKLSNHRRELEKAAHKRKAITVKDPSLFAGNAKTQEIDIEKLPNRYKNKIKTAISYSPQASAETVAHEIGHAQTSNTPILRKFQQRSLKDRTELKPVIVIRNLTTHGTNPEGIGYEYPNNQLKERGIKRTIGNFLKSKRIIAEERLANRNGLSILKKDLNIDKPTIKRIKNQYRKDTDASYKLNDITWKSSLRNTIAPKVRGTNGEIIPTTYAKDLRRKWAIEDRVNQRTNF